MNNPFAELSEKLDTVINRLDAIEKGRSSREPEQIPFPDFCKQFGISRVSGYAWANRGLIQLIKIGGRNYVPKDSIRVDRKFQREPSA